MSTLFSSLTIKNINLKNRIVMSPMCQYSSADGFSNDWHLVHLGSRAVGGAALIFTEATAVSPEGRISPSDLGLWKDEHITGLKRITDFIHQHGAVSGIQLAHAGRKASCAVPWEGSRQLDVRNGGWQTIAPDKIPYIAEDKIPDPLSKEGISRVISDFRSAALRAKAAGFKVLEIHSAHGYLLHEFLSPLSNKRTDEYGGSFENRIRFIQEIVKAIRTVWTIENPLFVRISATDWTPGGWTLEDSVSLAGVLRNAGVDLIDCSSGGNVHHTHITASPGYLVPFSEAVRKTGILTGTVGLITSSLQAESIIRDDKADLVFMARELLRTPYFPLQAALELGFDAKWPLQYLRARKK